MESSLASLTSAAITVFTALIFARAAVHKLAEFTEFTGFVDDYRLIDERLVRPVSAAIVAALLYASSVKKKPKRSNPPSDPTD